MQRHNLLEFKHYRHLKASGLLMALAIIAYLVDQPDTGAHGGTLLGYLLGIFASIIIAAQVMYGIRKRMTPKLLELRQFNSLQFSEKDHRAHKSKWGWHHGEALQGWLSAHQGTGLDSTLYGSGTAGTALERRVAQSRATERASLGGAAVTDRGVAGVGTT